MSAHCRASQARFPQMWRANWTSLDMMVTYAWMEHTFISSNRPTKYALLASWSGRTLEAQIGLAQQALVVAFLEPTNIPQGQLFQACTGEAFSRHLCGWGALVRSLGSELLPWRFTTSWPPSRLLGSYNRCFHLLSLCFPIPFQRIYISI